MIEASKNSGLEVRAAAAYWLPLSGINARYLSPSRSLPNSEAGRPVSAAPASTRSAATASVTGWFTGATSACAGAADMMIAAAAVAVMRIFIIQKWVQHLGEFLGADLGGLSRISPRGV